MCNPYNVWCPLAVLPIWQMSHCSYYRGACVCPILVCDYSIVLLSTHIYMYIHPSTCTSTHVHVHPPMYMYIHLSTCTSTHLHVHPPIYMYIYPCTYLPNPNPTHLQRLLNSFVDRLFTEQSFNQDFPLVSNIDGEKGRSMAIPEGIR